MTDYDVSYSKQIIDHLNILGTKFPCPFCKGNDLDYCDGPITRIRTEYIAVYCRKCNACGPCATDRRQADVLWMVRE